MTTATPEAAPTSPEKNTAPKRAGFEEFFSQVGDRRDVLLRNRIDTAAATAVSNRAAAGAPALAPKELAAERKEITADEANAIDQQIASYGYLANQLIDIAHTIKPDMKVGMPGAELAAVNDALPGIDGIVRIAHANIENGVDNPTTEQSAFLQAMDYRASAELRRSMPPIITPDDFANNPHLDAAGNPLTYEQQQTDSIDFIRQKLVASEAEARANHDTAAADAFLQDLQDLDEYENAETPPRTPAYRRNPLAAQAYAEQILQPTHTPVAPPASPVATAEYTEMMRQSEIDRVYVKFDGLVKEQMKENLDQRDNELVGTLKTAVEAAQNNIVAGTARNRQRVFNSNQPVRGRAAYDRLAAQLGAQELRVARRIGLTDGGNTHYVRTAAEVNTFLAERHIARSTALSGKVLRHMAENRTWGDKVSSFWAGKDEHGNDEKKMLINVTRKVIKLGAVSSIAALGVMGAPITMTAMAAGFYVGARKWSNNTAEHNKEIRSHAPSSYGNVEQLVGLMNNPTYDAVLKLRQAQRLERSERRSGDRKEAKRRKIDISKGVGMAALTGFSPLWAPVAGNLLGAAAHSAWTGGSSLISSHPSILWTGAAAVPITMAARKAEKGGSHGGHH